MKKRVNATEAVSNSRVLIGPPGVGKTVFKQKHPGKFIDPQDSINWQEMDQRYGLYPFEKFRTTPHALYEHELDWSLLWTEEVLPRVFAALNLRKDIIMGLIAPLNVEAVARFLTAFRAQSSLILPPEKEHYGWTRNDEKIRPRMWGSEFRSWKNTYWLRLLLRGLAEEVGIGIIPSPMLGSGKRGRYAVSASRRAVDKDGRVFVETFIGRWAELDAHEEILAMHTGASGSDGSITLTCDTSAKACAKGAHACTTSAILRTDAGGIPLAQWIPRDKLRSIAKNKKNAVIFFVGTLAPFHRGHLDLLNSAKKYLESKGWNVVAGYASTFENIEEERTAPLHSLLGDLRHRNALLQLGALHSDWVMADLPVAHVLRPQLLKEGKHPTQMLAKRLRESAALDAKSSVTTFWINGSDAHLEADFFKQFAEHADDDSLNPLRMLVVENRTGENKWSEKNLIESVPQLANYLLRYRHHMKEPTSATLVRNAMLSGDRLLLQKLIGLPLVESYLLGILHKHVPHS